MKYLLSMLLVCGTLWGYDYSRCGERIALSVEKVGDSYGIAIDKRRLLHYSKTPPKSHKILKSDPFIGLYLLEAKRPKVPLELRDITSEVLEDGLGVGSVKGFKEGKITKRMSALLSYAQFSQKTPPNSVISSICYQFYGLGIGGNRFIESGYIKRFLEQKGALYGDLGVRFAKGQSPSAQKPVVALFDPFAPNNKFRIDDEFISINNHKISSVEQLNNYVYTLAPNSYAHVSVKRGDSVEVFDVLVQKRTGGMLLPDNFMERFRVKFSSDWRLLEMNEAPLKGMEKLKVGDQILRINGMDMPLGDEGWALLARQAHGAMKWLVRRGDFQFFLQINKPSSEMERTSW